MGNSPFPRKAQGPSPRRRGRGLKDPRRRERKRSLLVAAEGASWRVVFSTTVVYPFTFSLRIIIGSRLRVGVGVGEGLRNRPRRLRGRGHTGHATRVPRSRELGFLSSVIHASGRETVGEGKRRQIPPAQRGTYGEGRAGRLARGRARRAPVSCRLPGTTAVRGRR